MIPDPIPHETGRVLLALFFGMHALSALATIGLSWTAAGAAWRGARRLERGVVAVAVINISVTVVLGVAALLFVSVVYNKSFFTSALLLFPALMSVVALLVVTAASLYAAKWLPWLDTRPRARAAALGLAGTASAAVAMVFAAIAGLSWSAPSPGDDWRAMLMESTWVTRWAMELALAGCAAAAALVLRYGWSDEDDYERDLVRGAGMAGAAFCVGAAAIAAVLAAKLAVLPEHPILVAAPAAGLLTAFLLTGFGRYRGRAAAVATAGMMLLLVAGVAVLREGLRSTLVG